MKLILLRCPKCSEPLKPNNDDIVIACHNCSSSVHIDEDGPKLINIRYALPSKVQEDIEVWVPFWVFEGQVKIKKRVTQSSRRLSTKDSLTMWQELQRFYVPAWDLTVHKAQDIGSKLAHRQPEMRYIEQPAGLKLTPAIISPADALRLLEFIVLAIEARRNDWLKEIEFEVEVGDPELYALPEAAIS